MSNTVDSVNVMYTTLQSGLVVSGNSYITLAKQLVSGDALTNLRVSGITDFIGLRYERAEAKPLLGATYTEIADKVDIDIYVHFTQSQVSGMISTSGAQGTLRQRVNDLKITVASGSFTNPPRPILDSEVWTMPQQQVAKATLTYRFRYLL